MKESEEAPLVDPDQLSEWIIYEDQDLLVFDKPGWLVCHPSKNGPWSSLVGAAKEYLNVDSIHLVSRLDRETSGVVMLAKHRKAASLWQKGVEQRKVSRRYLTILQGELFEAVHISTFLGKDPDSEVFVKQRVTEQSRKAQKSKTSFYLWETGISILSVLCKQELVESIKSECMRNISGLLLLGTNFMDLMKTFILSLSSRGGGMIGLIYWEWTDRLCMEFR